MTEILEAKDKQTEGKLLKRFDVISYKNHSGYKPLKLTN